MAWLDLFLKKYFWLAAVVAFFLPAALIVIFAVLPFWEKYSVAADNLVQRSDILAKKQKAVDDASWSQGKLAALSAVDIKKLKELLPAEKSTENLLQIFEDKAKANGFVLKNIDFSEPQGKEAASAGKVKILKIAANFSGGDYIAFKNLLGSIEKNARLVDVASVNFVAKANNYALNMNTYWLSSVGGTSGRLDDQFFANPAFQTLESSQVELKAEPIGKENPFK